MHVHRRIFELSSIACASSRRCDTYMDAVGRFYARLRQDLILDHMPASLVEHALSNGRDCFECVLEKTAIDADVELDSERYELVTQCRDTFSDLLPLLNSLGELARRGSIVKHYQSSIEECVRLKKTARYIKRCQQ